MNTPMKWLTKEERRRCEDRIVKLRDDDGLTLKVIAQRLGFSIFRVQKYYKRAKERRLKCLEK